MDLRQQLPRHTERDALTVHLNLIRAARPLPDVAGARPTSPKLHLGEVTLWREAMVIMGAEMSMGPVIYDEFEGA